MSSNTFVLSIVYMLLTAIMTCVVATEERHQEILPIAWPIESYLEMPNLTEVDRGAFDFFRDLTQAMELSTPGEVLQMFERLEDKLYQTGRMDMIFQDKRIHLGDCLYGLLELAEDEPTSNYPSVDVFMKLVKYVYGSLEVMSGQSSAPAHDIALFNYLKHYGKFKYTTCLQRLSGDFWRAFSRFNGISEGLLDDLIASQEDHQLVDWTGDRDVYLAREANKIDLTSLGGFDPKGMFEVMRQSREEMGVKESGSKRMLLTEFLDIHCRALLGRFEDLLEIFNMIRLLSPTTSVQQAASVPPKLGKFNEYARLCHQLFAPNTREQVEANLKKGLESPLISFAKNLFSCG